MVSIKETFQETGCVSSSLSYLMSESRYMVFILALFSTVSCYYVICNTLLLGLQNVPLSLKQFVSHVSLAHTANVKSPPRTVKGVGACSQNDEP